MMITDENLERIHVRYSGEYLLRQMAEECTELAQAALKLIRAMRRETGVSVENAMIAMLGELADVAIMTDCVRRSMCSDTDRDVIDTLMDAKSNRMVKRLLDNAPDTFASESSGSSAAKSAGFARAGRGGKPTRLPEGDRHE